MLVFTGINQVYTENQGTFISSERYDEVLRHLGRGEILGDFFGLFGIEFAIPSKVLFVVVILVIAMLVYRNTRFGVKVRAIGSNELAARTSGINADGVIIFVYIITAVTAALAAILWVSTVQTASPRIGVGWELNFITAVVLGGTALSGGKGNLIGTFIGAILVAFIGMCLNFLSVPEAMIVLITGGVLLFALSINGIKLIMLREVG
jgi:ribose transport system permease protein